MKLSNLTPIVLVENDDELEDSSSASFDTVQEIRAEVFPFLKHEIEKLNRRAQKLGTPPIVMNKKREFTKPHRDKDKADNGMMEKWFEVEVLGNPPQIPGYQFLATIQHTEAGNIILTVPGVNENGVKQFYNAKPDYCDHCQKKRKRIDTFIIKDEKSGHMRQIGRNCLADFLGGKNPQGILFWFNIKSKISDIFDEATGYSGPKSERQEWVTDKEKVLYTAAGLINLFGYKKATNKWGEYNNDSTKGTLIWLLFHDTTKYDRDEKRELHQKIDANKEKNEEYVKNALNWFNNEVSDEEKENNNFYHTLDVILKRDVLGGRNIGQAIALFPAYDRAMGKKQEFKKKSNDWIGQPGDKLEPFKVKVVNTNWIQGGYGEVQLVKMEDDSGNSYTWWNSSRHEMEKDKEYEIKGTVKKHDEYKDRKTTVLVRVNPTEI